MSRAPLTFRIHRQGQLVREEILGMGVIKIGKVPSAHLRIDDDSVSRMHAILEVDPKGTIYLIDLGSTRGTFVNGKKIHKAEVIAGDVIQVGDTSIEVGVTPAQAAVPVPVPLPVPVPVPVPVFATAPPPPAPIAVSAVAPIAFSPARLAPLQPGTGMGRGTGMSTGTGEHDDPHATAIEVAALFGDSIVHVKHCMDPRGGKIRSLTKAILATGAIAVTTAAIAFVSTVAMASSDEDALHDWTAVRHRPAWAFRPHHASPLTDGLAVGGLALGLGALATGLARARRERRSPLYRIGTAPDVEHAIEGAPAESFPLVAPRGDDFVLNVGHGMTGELTVDGIATPFSELVAAGRAFPSHTLASTIEVPIPARAKILARVGATTFAVNAVARPREAAAPLITLDGRVATFVAGSLALHLGLIALMAFAGESSAGVALDMPSPDDVGISTKIATSDDPPPDVQTPTEANDADSGGGGKAVAMAEGLSGTTETNKTDGHRRVEDRSPDKALSREEARAMARESGVLGSELLASAVDNMSGGDADLSSGFDRTTVWGGLVGAEGESFGTGAGRFGLGQGGGCMDGMCGIATGKYGTIRDGRGAGTGYGPGTGDGTGLRKHNPGVPTVAIGHPTSGDGLDREIIRRYVRRQQQRISYCYEKQLLAQPNLEGDVVVAFLILPNGSVQGSRGDGMSPEVASCVAEAVGAINFPAPKDGGSVQVRYPFHFHSAGKQ